MTTSNTLKNFQSWTSFYMPPHLPKGFWIGKKQMFINSPNMVTLRFISRCLLGDLTSNQLRALAVMDRKYVQDTVRTTVDQNLLFRWVSEADLPEFFEDLKAIGLAQAGANSISDITSCPGTDTCKLGISASRGLARELSQRLDQTLSQLPKEVKNLKIKVSGCPNSCSQHHLADLGFYGVSRKSGSYTVPHFQLVLGGEWKNNGGSYGLAVAAVPSKRIPETVKRLTEKFVKERLKEESFQAFVQRIGKVEIKNSLQDLMVIPSHEVEPELFTDWGDIREYTIADIGKGECAGEVVAPSEFSLTAAESKGFEAQLKLDQKDLKSAVTLAYQSMIFSAEGVVRTGDREWAGTTDATVAEFKKKYLDTGEFVKHVNNVQFAAFLLKAHENPLVDPNPDEAHRRVEEAQLFLEASHSYIANAAPSPETFSAK